MIEMALLSVIRRWHFREGMPIRDIRRPTGVSRNTIREYLRGDVVEPLFRVPARPSKLDAFAEKLSGWLRGAAAMTWSSSRSFGTMRGALAGVTLMVNAA